MFPYKIQKQQSLTDVDKERRVTFRASLRQYLEDNSTVIRHIWFCDEEHFHLNGYVNKQNVHAWGTDTPHTVMEKSLHPQKHTVRRAISSAGIVGPVFLDDTVNAGRYPKLRKHHFVPSLQCMGVNMEETFFQKYRARTHTVNVIHFLSEYSHESPSVV
jgi:hypothetical protein